MKQIEGLACIEYGEVLGNYISDTKHKELIFESNPGLSYDGRFSFPLNYVEHDLYLIIKSFKHCHQDTILRIYQKIKECMQHDFSSFPGQIKTETSTYSCIKLQVKSGSHINDILKAYHNEGVTFKKNKKIKRTDATIITKEFIRMTESENNIFKDDFNKDVTYIEIPKHIDWKELQKITKIIKNTYQYKDFKTSIVSIFEEDHYREFISMYIKGGCECERVNEIKNNFLEKIN